METRRNFIKRTTAAAIGSVLLPAFVDAAAKDPNNKSETTPSTDLLENIGVQLYTFRTEMLANPHNTLKQIASLGFKEIESAGSNKGNYYGLTPKEMKQACGDLGMTLRSGHVHLNAQWEQTMAQAAEAGQEYLICSSMPTHGQTTDNYKAVAERFNKAGEDCKKLNIKFGYHNHDSEFARADGKVLYDVLLNHTDPSLVHMELDLGWVIASGNDPVDYFKRFNGRFPLWHLKDMNMEKRESTEFGNGGLNILKMLQNKELSGAKYIFVEQEDYAVNPFESMKHNLKYLSEIKL